MKKFCFIALLSLALPLAQAHADEELPAELLGLDLSGINLPDKSDNPESKKKHQNSIIPFIQTSLPRATQKVILQNLSEPEQIFCYHVAKRHPEYTGYSLNNFAILDYCGELNISQTATTYEALFAQSPNIITTQSSCKIQPQVMLRFVRGVDSVDVLLSSPCPSFTIFYAGRHTSFNIKQGIIDDIINQFSENNESFNSPALIKQTIANGKATTEQEQEQYELKKREEKPLNDWSKDETKEKNDTPKKHKGWGNIKLNM